MSAFLLRAMITASSTPSPSKSPTSSGLQLAFWGMSPIGFAPPILARGGEVTTSNPPPNCFSTSAASSEGEICALDAEGAGAAGAEGAEGACPQTRKPALQISKIKARLELLIRATLPRFGAFATNLYRFRQYYIESLQNCGIG